MSTLVLFVGNTENIMQDEDVVSLTDMLLAGPYKGYVVNETNKITAIKGLSTTKVQEHWAETLETLKELEGEV